MRWLQTELFPMYPTLGFSESSARVLTGQGIQGLPCRREEREAQKEGSTWLRPSFQAKVSFFSDFSWKGKGLCPGEEERLGEEVGATIQARARTLARPTLLPGSPLESELLPLATQTSVLQNYKGEWE